MNIHLREVICTSKDGDRFWRMPECYVRGNIIKYLRVPDESSGFDQPTQTSIDQSPLQEMSIQDMEDLKQHYLDKMLSLSNDLQIKDYHNEKIDIRFRRECESMIDELKGKFNGMSIEINKKKELQQRMDLVMK
ncbi:reverse transcriptase domain-containing protein [Tanacetum coccineum]